MKQGRREPSLFYAVATVSIILTIKIKTDMSKVRLKFRYESGKRLTLDLLMCPISTIEETIAEMETKGRRFIDLYLV